MITIAIASAIILLFALLLAPSGWSDVLSSTRNELVFADRNRDYGAYMLRREHHRVLFLSMLMGMGLIAVLFVAPWLIRTPTTVPLPQLRNEVEVVFDVPLPDPPAPKPEPKRVQPLAAAAPAIGIPLAVDTMPPNPVDTALASTPDPGPATGPGPDPRGEGRGGEGGGNGSDDGNRVREMFEADSSPAYIGGDKALYAYLNRNTNYPEKARATGKQGRVVVSFVVAADGGVTDAKVIKGVSAEIDAEALRVVRAMGKWLPGKYKGDPVPVRFNLPIVFTLH